MPWISRVDRGPMPKPGSETFKTEPYKRDICPYCKGLMTKAEMHFNTDLGMWIKRRTCIHCGVTSYEQPERTLS